MNGEKSRNMSIEYWRKWEHPDCILFIYFFQILKREDTRGEMFKVFSYLKERVLKERLEIRFTQNIVSLKYTF